MQMVLISLIEHRLEIYLHKILSKASHIPQSPIKREMKIG